MKAMLVDEAQRLVWSDVADLVVGDGEVLIEIHCAALNRADLIALCGRLPDSYEDYPFDDPNWTVMRHRTNRRSYALIFERQGRLWVNVKAEPAWGDFWKQTYPAVVPAYHMNKRHWIGIVLDGSMTADQIFDLIAESYRLTAPRAAKSR